MADDVRSFPVIVLPRALCLPKYYHLPFDELWPVAEASGAMAVMHVKDDPIAVRKSAGADCAVFRRSDEGVALLYLQNW